MSESEIPGITEIQRPRGSFLLPDEFIEDAKVDAGVDEFTVWLDANLGKTIRERSAQLPQSEQNEYRIKTVIAGLSRYATQKEYAWSELDNPHQPLGFEVFDKASKQTLTHDFRQGRESGMREMLVSVLGFGQEVKIIDHLFTQAESAVALPKG